VEYTRTDVPILTPLGAQINGLWAPSVEVRWMATDEALLSAITNGMPIPTTSPSNKLSTGAIAGIAVGGALGLILLLTGLVTFLFWRKKKMSAKSTKSSPDIQGAGMVDLKTDDMRLYPEYRIELEGGTSEGPWPSKTDDMRLYPEHRIELEGGSSRGSWPSKTHSGAYSHLSSPRSPLFEMEPQMHHELSAGDYVIPAEDHELPA
jgi:hypothetical protein